MHNMLRLNEFKKYKMIKVKNIKDIYNINFKIKNKVELFIKY